MDGTYGADLKTAIEAYEKAEGLTVTGLATVALLQRLGGGVAVERAKPARRGKTYTRHPGILAQRISGHRMQ